MVIDFWVGFCGAGNNHDKGEPRELAGEPNTAVKGFFSFATKERLARLKKTGSCSEEEEENKKHDKLERSVTRREPKGGRRLFSPYKTFFLKKVPDGLACFFAD